jgi:hypothetical protein
VVGALLVERGASAADAIDVASWPFCLVYLHTQTCACGGEWTAGDHRLKGMLEVHQATCESCGSERQFWFDLRRVLTDPWGHDRFEQMRELFSHGLDALENQDSPQAIQHLSEVAAREPWFGLAWLHLGMAHMLGEDPESARGALERAVGLLPMDGRVRRSLAGCYTLLGLDARAEREEELANLLDD